MTTKKISELTLCDRLSRLDYQTAVKLLGSNARKLMAKYSSYDFTLEDQVRLKLNELTVKFGLIDTSTEDSPATFEAGSAVVTFRLANDARRQIEFACSTCDGPCEHVGVAMNLVLEEKTALGLAVAPPERIIAAGLSEEELTRMAIDERRTRSQAEKMKIQSADAERPWTDYLVTSEASGKTYRVSLRGTDLGDSLCTCPDFRTNTLGTCKHVMKVLSRVQRKFSKAQLSKKFQTKRIGLQLNYCGEAALRWELPPKLSDAAEAIVGAQRDKPITNIAEAVRRVAKLEQLGDSVMIYPDAEEFIQQRLFRQRIQQRMAEIRENVSDHPLRRELLKIELLPYQLDGIAFATGAGRAILADDMGLGKTIQGVGTAELLAREAGIKKVLIVCPASLKSQWKNEIHRFCHREVQLITGSSKDRQDQYTADCFFYDLQLRTSAARPDSHRTCELGFDHSRRRATHQELGGADHTHHQGTQVSVCLGTVRNAVGESD